jgi:hypothetical protein
LRSVEFGRCAAPFFQILLPMGGQTAVLPRRACLDPALPERKDRI